MIGIKCVKCGGEMSLECDHYGYYLSCLQCSNIVYLDGVKFYMKKYKDYEKYAIKV